MKYKIQFLIIFSTFIFITACGNKNTTNHNHEDAEHNDSHEVTNSVSFTKDQINAIKLEFGKIEKKQLTAALRANGILNVPNQNKATISALMGGVIKSIFVQTGNNVNKGQVIATIANTSFITLQEDYLNTTSKLDLAENEFKRQQDLQSGNATSLKILQIAEAEVKSLKAKKSSLKKQLELVGINPLNLTSDNIQTVINILSPISGAISAISVNIGTYVDANNPIAEVIDNSQLHLDLFVYEKDLAKLKEGQTIHFTLTNNPGKEYDAKVYAISNTFEENSKAIAVHAMVEGDKVGLINGMGITAIVSLENATVDAVPTDAIVNYKGQDYIFAVSEKNNNENEHNHSENHDHSHEHNSSIDITVNGDVEFEKIPIKKGTTDIGYSEVVFLTELKPNTKIVTKGAFFILAKMTNSGEHSH
ncbi:MAG: efflux RND transporter periplasmic adaptor subunit [Bacteroidetes bacterium]|nr:efflux RND transporter periplasmic adaptor subunit [Bacteroidota bacterium]